MRQLIEDIFRHLADACEILHAFQQDRVCCKQKAKVTCSVQAQQV